MRRIERIGVFGFLAFMVTLVEAPVFWVFRLSLVSSEGGHEAFTLKNFARFMGIASAGGSSLFLRQLFNSLVVAAGTTLLGLTLSCPAAFALSRASFWGRGQLLRFLMVTQMFPAVMMAIPIYVLMGSLGLLDSLIGLILIYSVTAIPFSIFMLKGFFDTLPRELDEAALMDGASTWALFWRILLPLAKPALVVTGLFSMMGAWNEFVVAATFLNREEAFTLPVVLQRVVGEYSTDWGLFAAGSIVVALPVVTLFFFMQKALVGGLTAGAVKE